MPNIWKIASRYGDRNSVIDIFRKYELVFTGGVENVKRIKNVKIEDILAITDGITIVALGKVLEAPKAITHFKMEKEDIESGRFDYKKDVVGVKVAFMDLNKNDRIEYIRGTFHAVHSSDIKNKIIKLSKNINTDINRKIITPSEELINKKIFSIEAKTCTLKNKDKNKDYIILDSNTKYVIPIYQRPYSWTEEQVNKFIDDIFISYWGNDNKVVNDPMFIGTMQLSEKKFGEEQNVIDGQQRLTTILLLLKILKEKYPDNTDLKNIDLNWLETRVNSGGQEKLLKEAIAYNFKNSNENILNQYIRNLKIIRENIDSEIKNEANEEITFNSDDFVKHILSNIYFVVIETYAGLSKTLQIFNAINTTGLDLDAGDVFKIRMYEYLKDKKQKDDSVFEEISRLYQKIDDKNNSLKRRVTDIRGILLIYQYILIAKYGLDSNLNKFSVDTFFEKLFDSILNINRDNYFKEPDKIDLSLEELDKIIDIRYKWESEGLKTSKDAMFVNLIWWSRYSRYWNLIFIFLYRYENDIEKDNKLYWFVSQLPKLYAIYSLKYMKAVSNIHTFSREIIKNILNEKKTFKDVLNLINNKIKTEGENYKDNYEILSHYLEENIVDNSRNKNILCRLSASLEEKKINSKDKDEIKKFQEKLFGAGIDIEHIQSYNDKNEEKRAQIWQEWGSNINSIGNLIVLEEKINRGIGNNVYHTKIKNYDKSNFDIVKKHCQEFPNWNLAYCNERKRKEKKKKKFSIFCLMINSKNNLSVNITRIR